MAWPKPLYRQVPRTWRERLLELPWRPWAKTKFVRDFDAEHDCRQQEIERLIKQEGERQIKAMERRVAQPYRAMSIDELVESIGSVRASDLALLVGSPVGGVGLTVGGPPAMPFISVSGGDFGGAGASGSWDSGGCSSGSDSASSSSDGSSCGGGSD